MILRLLKTLLLLTVLTKAEKITFAQGISEVNRYSLVDREIQMSKQHERQDGQVLMNDERRILWQQEQSINKDSKYQTFKKIREGMNRQRNYKKMNQKQVGGPNQIIEKLYKIKEIQEQKMIQKQKQKLLKLNKKFFIQHQVLQEKQKETYSQIKHVYYSHKKQIYICIDVILAVILIRFIIVQCTKNNETKIQENQQIEQNQQLSK